MAGDFDVWDVLLVHHFELAIPLALVALGARAASGQWSSRIMPVFFGLAMAPFAGSVLIAWPRWHEPFPAYLLAGDAFALNNPLWLALYFPGWGACALIALLHPFFSGHRIARSSMWVLATLALCGQAYVVLTSTQLR
jgi:hypothetical protein